jgi:hypothetical protein
VPFAVRVFGFDFSDSGFVFGGLPASSRSEHSMQVGLPQTYIRVSAPQNAHFATMREEYQKNTQKGITANIQEVKCFSC